MIELQEKDLMESQLKAANEVIKTQSALLEIQAAQIHTIETRELVGSNIDSTRYRLAEEEINALNQENKHHKRTKKLLIGGYALIFVLLLL